MFGSRSRGLNDGGGVFRRPVAVMVAVVDAEDFVVESRPARVVFAGRFPVERMAGGPDADERPALGQVRADEVELRLGRCAATDAQEEQVGFLQRPKAGEIVRVVFIHVHKRAADAAVPELSFCKRWKGRGGVVFTLADHEHDVRWGVAPEAERLTVEQLVASGRRTDPLLDVLDDERGAAKVIHIRPARRVVHRVGQVADEQNIFAVARHVAQAEGAAEHAHVRVHADEQHVADAARLEQVPDLDAAVTDRVALGIDLDQVHLPLPRAARVAAKLGQVLGPGGVLRGVVVLAAVGVVDRVALVFLHLVDPVTPVLDGLGLRSGGGGSLGSLAGRVVFVKFHARRRRVDDQRALGPGRVEEPVHAGRHLADAADGVFAVV